MWNAWTAPPGARTCDYDPWACEAHCARCGELAQDCDCEDDDDMSGQQPDVRQLVAKLREVSRTDAHGFVKEVAQEVADLIDTLMAIDAAEVTQLKSENARLKKDVRTLREEKRHLQDAIDINVQTMTLLAERARTAEAKLADAQKPGEDNHDIDDRTR